MVSLSLVNIKWLNGQETGTFSLALVASFPGPQQNLFIVASVLGQLLLMIVSVGPSHPCSVEENRDRHQLWQQPCSQHGGPGNEANLYTGHYPRNEAPRLVLFPFHYWSLSLSANLVPIPPPQLSSLAVSVVFTLTIEAVGEDWEWGWTTSLIPRPLVYLEKAGTKRWVGNGWKQVGPSSTVWLHCKVAFSL